MHPAGMLHHARADAPPYRPRARGLRASALLAVVMQTLGSLPDPFRRAVEHRNLRSQRVFLKIGISNLPVKAMRV